jgi:pyruvate/2-oxoglutarate/acetoin dehydrogenase E1 component
MKEGNEVTIIAFGAAVHWALDTLANNPEISADLLDLRTLQPLDTEAIFASVKKNRRDYLSGRQYVWRYCQRYISDDYGGML